MRSANITLLLLAIPSLLEAAEPEILVRATPDVPVSADEVAAQLRTELPDVAVLVATGPDAAAGAAVTLALSPDARLMVVYQDAEGRETARIVADTTDSQAMAAAVAMIVANLHRDQLAGTLSAIGAPPAPASPAARASAPPAPAPRASAGGPALHARADAASREGWLAVSWSPVVDLVPDQGAMLGVSAGLDARIGAWRVELHVGYGLPTARDGADWLDGRYESYHFDVTRISGLLMLRRSILGDGPVRLGVGGGVGLGITSFDLDTADLLERRLSPTPYEDSYLDALFVASTSFEVHVGGPAWWSSRVDGVLSTNEAATGWFADSMRQFWFTVATGARVVL